MSFTQRNMHVLVYFLWFYPRVSITQSGILEISKKKKKKKKNSTTTLATVLLLSDTKENIVFGFVKQECV